MFNKSDIYRDAFQLFGRQSRCGYDWWWHSFTAHNAVTGEAKPFYIEFFTCNPALGGKDPVFGQLPGNKSKGKRPSYLMVNVGSWGKDSAQLHRFFGWDEVKIDAGVPYSIEADDCFVNETFTRGSVRVVGSDQHPEWMCDDGEMSWNLKIDKKVAFNVGYGAGDFFRRMQLFEMFWHAEGMKTLYEGEITWNGQSYVVSPDSCYGYADKNWGKDFTSPWLWLSSCNLTSNLTGRKLNDSVFDIGGGCPKVGGLALPRKLLAAFWYEGRPFEFNFSKLWTNVKTIFEGKETDTQILWHVDQCSTSGRMVTDIECDKSDMLLINYEAPDGMKRHNRLWNGGNGCGRVVLYDTKGNIIDDIKAENVGCEYGEYC